MKSKITFIAMLFATFSLGLLAFAADPLLDSANHKAGWSNPILVGNGNPNEGDRAKRAQVSATHLNFFKHPIITEGLNGSSNFKSQSVQGSGQAPIIIPNIVATPGSLIDASLEEAVISDDPTKTFLQPLANTSTPAFFLHGFGPKDFYTQTQYGSSQRNVEFQVSSNNNYARSLFVADVRNENPSDEFLNVFGVQPLEVTLIGSANYSGSLSLNPAAISSKEKGAYYCAIDMNPLSNFDCADDMIIGDNSYKDTVLYDLAQLQLARAGERTDLIASVSYDPIRVSGKAEIATTTFGNTSLSNKEISFNYYSPIVFFHTSEKNKEVKLLGYISFDDKPMSDELKDNYGVMNSPVLYELADFLNTAEHKGLPIHVNPIAINHIVTKETLSKDLLAVTYQNTLFKLDDLVLNSAGRPLNYRTAPKKYGQVLFLKKGEFSYLPMMSPEGTLIPEILFPTGVMSPVMFFKKAKDWNVDSYTNSNPTNLFEPFIGALIDPGDAPSAGVYDAEVIEDKYVGRGLVQVEESFLAIPSSIGDETIVYLIDPMDKTRQLYIYSGLTTKCLLDPCTPPTGTYSALPIYLPAADPIRFKSPAGGFVPYNIKAAKLDNNDCDDLIITYRGKDTVKVADGYEFRADDGNTSFSNIVRIAYRESTLDGCVFREARDFPMTHSQIAAVELADINGDSLVDLVLGNLLPEKISDDEKDAKKYASFAYIVLNGGLDTDGVASNFSPIECNPPIITTGCTKRLRVGFSADSEQSNVSGVSAIAANREMISFINGYPLVLPPVGCPGSDKIDVTSVFETKAGYKYDQNSVGYAGLDSWPFKTEGVPIPQRCIDEAIPMKFKSGTSYINVPLWDGPDGQTNVYCEALISLCYKSGDEYLPKQGIGDVACEEINLLCKSVSFNSESPASKIIKLAEDTSADTNSGTEFAAWRPDVIVSADRAAIGDVNEMVQVALPQPKLPRAIVPRDPREMTSIIKWVYTPSVEPPIDPACDPNAAEPCGVNPDGKSFCGFDTKCNKTNCQCEAIPPDVPLCPNGSVDVGEQCDPLDPASCSSGQTCKADCSACEEVPITCGNNKKETGETCDGNDGCGLNQTCDEGCGMCLNTCTQVVGLQGSEECSYLDRLESMGKGEATIEPLFQCGSGKICNDQCKCEDIPPEIYCGNGVIEIGANGLEQCEVGKGCANPTDVCTAQCTCIPCPNCGEVAKKPIEPPLDSSMPVRPADDSFVKCEGFSNETMKNQITLNNDMYRQITGRTDDLFCEAGQYVSITSFAKDGARLGASASEGVLPYMYVQKSGTELNPMKSDVYKVLEVNEPLRIMPLPESSASKSLVLPQLSSSTISVLGGVTPAAMPAESVQTAVSSGVTTVNDMYQHFAKAVIPTEKAASAGGTNGANATSVMHYFRMRLPVDYPTHSTLDSFKEALPEGFDETRLYVENRKLDPGSVFAELRARVDSGKLKTSDINSDLPWDNNLKYDIVLVQDKLKSASTAESSEEVASNLFSVLADNGIRAQGGGGCKCNISENAPDTTSYLPLLLLVAMSSGSLVFARSRAKRRK